MRKTDPMLKPCMMAVVEGWLEMVGRYLLVLRRK